MMSIYFFETRPETLEQTAEIAAQTWNKNEDRRSEFQAHGKNVLEIREEGDEIEWSPCSYRKNLAPDGGVYISYFPNPTGLLDPEPIDFGLSLEVAV